MGQTTGYWVPCSSTTVAGAVGRHQTGVAQAGPPDLHLELTFSQICNTDWPERTRKQSDQFGANVFSTVGWMDGWTLEWLVFFVVWKKVRLPA